MSQVFARVTELFRIDEEYRMSRMCWWRKGCWKNPTVQGTILGIAAAAVIAAAAAGIGFRYGQVSAIADSLPARFIVVLEAIFEEDRKILEKEGRRFQAQLDVFAGRVGEMQAELLRLNALGGRLVRMARLNSAEFDFESPVPVGGPADVRGTRETGSELAKEIINLPAFIDDRKRKLEQLELAIMEKGLKKQATPSGWPIRSGYISSGYGRRTHPILKESYFHKGVDFAGQPGTPIFATADGVVIYSDEAPGYGLVVEIRHMDGLVTCYAHNQENLVKEGDLVKRGQIIARLGSSGRSTGPHVHFEVRKDGETINPMSYIGTGPNKRSGG